jgi:extracellular factor (EF) 3-hydroxypalmitic acid methyl ester biosynthesis protein
VARNRLQHLTPNDWLLISARAKRRTFKLGEILIHQGTPGDRIFIIRNGEAEVALAATSTREVVAVLGPDDICGDMAFLERGTTSAAVVAKSVELEADEILWDELRDLFEGFPRLAARFYMSLALVLARRLRETSKELAREMANSDRKD